MYSYEYEVYLKRTYSNQFNKSDEEFMDKKGYTIDNQYAAYFLTFTVVGWVDLFTRPACKTILIDSLKYCQEHKGLIVHAYVIMSNHVHLVLRAEEGSAGLSAIIRDFKKFTSKSLLKWVLTSSQESRREWLEIVFKHHGIRNTNNTTYQVWQQKSCPKILLHSRFTNQKINYIHNNPVAAKIVDKPEDYVYSSARNYMNIPHALLDVNVIDFGVEEGYVFT